MNFETSTPELKNYLNQIFEELKKRGENIAIAYANETKQENTAEFNCMFFCNNSFIYELANVVTDHLEEKLKKEGHNAN